MQNLSSENQSVGKPDLSRRADFFRDRLTHEVRFGNDDLEANQLQRGQTERGSRGRRRTRCALVCSRGADPVIEIAETIPGLNPVDPAASDQFTVLCVGDRRFYFDRVTGKFDGVSASTDRVTRRIEFCD